MSIWGIILHILAFLTAYYLINDGIKVCLEKGDVFKFSQVLVVPILAFMYPINLMQDIRADRFSDVYYLLFMVVVGVLTYLFVAYVFYAKSITKKNAKKISENK